MFGGNIFDIESWLWFWFFCIVIYFFCGEYGKVIGSIIWKFVSCVNYWVYLNCILCMVILLFDFDIDYWIGDNDEVNIFYI